ncbi:MAG: response regulator [Candidatus Thorarchaeota archaeon]
MNPLIFVVDDDLTLLQNLRHLLEVKDYDVITANNGLLALELLSTSRRIPEIIISDIIMPEMDGYDLFESVSNNNMLNHIPFIFLSGRNTPDDVRFGKMLGVDDYLTKPFEIDDLLAIISGKISRNKNIKEINEKIEILLSSVNMSTIPSISEEERSDVILLVVFWDDKIGPKLVSSFPDKGETSFSVEKVGQQLFHAIVSLYGYQNINKAEGILLNIENFKRKGYIFFDSIQDEKIRGRERRYMIGLVAPKINYFDSLKIKEVLKDLSSKIKEQIDWRIEIYWEKLSAILTSHF